jgi:hypothetical protein
MLDFQTVTFSFPPEKGDFQTLTKTAVFDSRLNKAQCAIQSFDVLYTDEDHHIKRLFVESHPGPLNNNTVNVTVNYELRDSSGDIDDLYEGVVDVLVIVDRA